MMSKTVTLTIVAILALGATARAEVKYETVAEAVAAYPELSLLATNLGDSTIANFSDPELVATLFAPTDSALQYLAAIAGQADPCTPNISALNEFGDGYLALVLNNHIVPDAAINTTELINGTIFTSKAGQPLLVLRNATMTTINTNGSYLNEAQIAKANIFAGKSVIHTVARVLLPSEISDLLAPPESLLGEAAPEPVAQPDCPVAALASTTNKTVAPETPVSSTPAPVAAPAPTPAPKATNAASSIAQGCAAAAMLALAAMLL